MWRWCRRRSSARPATRDDAWRGAYATYAGGACLRLAAGETTVSVTGTGRGGRNQELVLAAAQELARSDLAGGLLSGGTDGIDGPTMRRARSPTTRRSRARKRRAWATGRAIWTTTTRTRSSRALSDLVITGPSDTNVGDIQILLSATLNGGLDGESEDRPLGTPGRAHPAGCRLALGLVGTVGRRRRASATRNCGCGWPKPARALARARVDLFELNYGQASRHLQQAEDYMNAAVGPARREPDAGGRRRARGAGQDARGPASWRAASTGGQRARRRGVEALDRTTGASALQVAHDAVPRRHPPRRSAIGCSTRRPRAS